MDDLLKHSIFNETDCISEQTMFDYIDKKLSAKECHVVEKHLLHCDLCTDALEGLELLRNRDRIRLINQKILEPQLMRASASIAAKEAKVISFNYKVVLSIAASILLLIGSVFFFKQLNNQHELAEYKSESIQETPPPPPPAPLESEPTSASAPDVKMDDAAGTTNETEAPKAESAVVSKESNGVVLQENKAVLSNLLTKDEKSSTGVDAMRSKSSIRDLALGRGESQNQEVPSPAKSMNDDMADKEMAFEQQEESKPKKKTKQSEEELINKESDYYGKDLPAAPAGAVAPTVAANDNAEKASVKASKKEAKSGLFGGLSKASEKRREVSVKEDVTKSIAYEPKSVATEDVVSAQTLDLLIVDSSQPEYPGGQDSLTKYINDSYKYPENYTTLGLNGKKIYVNFVVDKDGKIKNAKIVKGLHSVLDKEALRIVNNMPKWNPAKRNGVGVEQEMNLPITLK